MGIGTEFHSVPFSLVILPLAFKYSTYNWTFMVIYIIHADRERY